MNTHEIESIVDRRSETRRADDTRRNATILALAGILIAGGIAWGTAMAVVQSKVDRLEYNAHVADAARRFLADSLERSYMASDLRAVKSTVLETNTRLSRYICDKQPAYCQ